MRGEEKGDQKERVRGRENELGMRRGGGGGGGVKEMGLKQGKG